MQSTASPATRRGNPGILFGVGAALAILVLLVLQAASTIRTTTPAYYTINGLTCADPVNTSPEVATLVTEITTSPRFLAATNGSLFVLGNYENITDRVQTIGVNVSHLPNVLELVFYGYGLATKCVRGSGPYVSLDVQVPIQNGLFNMTGMQITTGSGPY